MQNRNMPACCVCLEDGRSTQECKICKEGTLCDACRGKLVRNDFLTCPVCRSLRFKAHAVKTRKRSRVMPAGSRGEDRPRRANLHIICSCRPMTCCIEKTARELMAETVKAVCIFIALEVCAFTFGFLTVISLFSGGTELPIWVFFVVGNAMCLLFYCAIICFTVLRWKIHD